MKSILTQNVCCPGCKLDLQFVADGNSGASLAGTWFCPCCHKEYKEEAGIIHFTGDDDVYRFSKREKFMRDIYARFYGPLTNLMFLPCGGEYRARREVLEHLELEPHSTILETGIGTGDNIKFMENILDGSLYYGLDNQLVMLHKCAKNSKKWRRQALLYRANAEELPFKDNSFDVVFHLGAINLFEDQKKAIDEMIRVARCGTRIVIADETEKAAKLFAIFTGGHKPVVPPIHLIPQDMSEISLIDIWNGYGYLISFRKPAG